MCYSVGKTEQKRGDSKGKGRGPWRGRPDQVHFETEMRDLLKHFLERKGGKKSKRFGAKDEIPPPCQIPVTVDYPTANPPSSRRPMWAAAWWLDLSVSPLLTLFAALRQTCIVLHCTLLVAPILKELVCVSSRKRKDWLGNTWGCLAVSTDIFIFWGLLSGGKNYTHSFVCSCQRVLPNVCEFIWWGDVLRLEISKMR